MATVATELIIGKGFTTDHRPIVTTDGGINGAIARIDAAREPKKPAPRRPTAAEWGDLLRTIRAVTVDPHQPMQLTVARDSNAFRAAVADHPKEPCIMVHATPRPTPYMPGPEIVTLDWSAAAYVPHFLSSATDGIWRLNSRSKGQAPIRVRVKPHGNRRDARAEAAKRAVATALALPERKIFDLLYHAAQHDRKIQHDQNRASKSRTIPIR